MDTRTRAAVLRWYRRVRRDLPWRRTRDPYAIWVSETMLQQTRSETVLRYYERFLRRFPTVRALARAPQSAVLAAWSGLGYYSRARNLHGAAKVIVRRHRGVIPCDVEALRALPGVGRYTAGAVASIAFGLPAPIIDGNVARVLTRWFAVDGDPRVPDVSRTLWQIAEGMLDVRSPGDWNQALMELGATVCTPRVPACPRCPLKLCCRARRSRAVDRYPGRSARPVLRAARQACVILQAGPRLLLTKRGDDEGLLAGLWEFPMVVVEADEEPEAALERRFTELGIDAVGLCGGAPVIRILHTITTRRIETLVFRARRQPRGKLPGACWFRRAELAELPLSAVGLRIAAALTAT